MNARKFALAIKTIFLPIFLLVAINTGLFQPAQAQSDLAKEGEQVVKEAEKSDKPLDKQAGVEAAEKTNAEKDKPGTEAKKSSDTESSGSSKVDDEEEIISISDALKQGQLAHEKNLVDKFLLGIAVLFLVIAFLLFNSLPPSSPESGS